MKQFFLVAILAIVFFFSCKKEIRNKVNYNTVCKIDTMKYKINSETINKAKIILYYLNDKYKKQYYFQNLNKLDSVPFRYVLLCENLRTFIHRDVHDYILSFCSTYKDNTVCDARYFNGVVLDSLYEIKYVIADRLDLSIKDIKIDSNDIAAFRKSILQDKYSDDWIINNLDKVETLKK